MNLIVRGVAGILFITGLVMNRVLWKGMYMDGKAKLFLELAGGNAGSIHATCDANAVLQKLSGPDQFQPEGSSTLQYNLYDIHDASQYLKGEDAIVVEKGPYKLKKHTFKYGVTFKQSTLTSDTSNSNSAIEFNEGDLYIPLDQNTNVKATKMVRSESDLSLSWEDGTIEDVTSYNKETPNHLSMTDEITNLSPIYQSLLGEVNDELSLALSFVCTPVQIENILSADTKTQCSEIEMNDMAKVDCSCCMTRAMYDTQGSPAGVTVCDEILKDSNVIMSDLSRLAYYDGGVVVKESGEEEYTGGANFVETLYKQDKIYSPVIQTHSVNDWLFGHPSAYMGKVLPSIYMSKAKELTLDQILTPEDVAKEILTGNLDAELPFQLGDLATYTKQVGSVCMDTCQEATTKIGSPLDYMCDGNAAERHELDDVNKVLLGGISCKPYSSTYATMHLCKAIDDALQIDPSDTSYEKCKCANGDDYSTSGCCLAAGMIDDRDLTTEGCLYPVEGILGSNYAGKYGLSASGPTIDLGKSAEALVSKEKESTKDAKTTQFVCPVKASTEVPILSAPELSTFGHYEGYEGVTENVIYHHTGNPRMRQTDHADSGKIDVTSEVKASSSEYFKPTGLTGFFVEHSLTNGHTHKGSVDIFKKETKASMAYTEDWGVRAILCDPRDSRDFCHVVARLRPSKSAFNATADTKVGTGLPYDGLEPIGLLQGPTSKGRPTYFHNPLYLHGDSEIFSQQDNSHVDYSQEGNGLKLYRPTVESPGDFSEDSAKFELVTNVTSKAFAKVDDELLDQLEFESYIDVEPATGTGVRSNFRHGISHSIWECDPETNDKCKIAQEGNCYKSKYPCSAANVLTPHVIGGKILPFVWYEDKTLHVSHEEIIYFTNIADKYRKLQQSYGTWIVYLITITWAVFLPLTFKIMWAAEEKSWLKDGSVEKKGPIVSNASSMSSQAET